jgi:hypothetical protein
MRNVGAEIRRGNHIPRENVAIFRRFRPSEFHVSDYEILRDHVGRRECYEFMKLTKPRCPSNVYDRWSCCIASVCDLIRFTREGCTCTPWILPQLTRLRKQSRYLRSGIPEAALPRDQQFMRASPKRFTRSSRKHAHRRTRAQAARLQQTSWGNHTFATARSSTACSLLIQPSHPSEPSSARIFAQYPCLTSPLEHVDNRTQHALLRLRLCNAPGASDNEALRFQHQACGSKRARVCELFRKLFSSCLIALV